MAKCETKITCGNCIFQKEALDSVTKQSINICIYSGTWREIDFIEEQADFCDLDDYWLKKIQKPQKSNRKR